MVDLECQSVPATRKNLDLFLKRLRVEVTYPDSRGSRKHRTGLDHYGKSCTLKEMEALFSGVRRSSFLYHLEIQPDDEVPGLYDLETLVRDTLSSLTWSSHLWVAVLHPSHGLFPHAHVFMTGPELTRQQLAEIRDDAQTSWDRAVKLWDEIVADAEARDQAFFAALHEMSDQAQPSSNEA